MGNEGLILSMGGETTPSRAIVQSAGHAYQLIGQRLKDEFHRNGEMQLLLLRYTQALGCAVVKKESDRQLPHPDRYPPRGTAGA